jgi:gas vesicle protein
VKAFAEEAKGLVANFSHEEQQRMYAYRESKKKSDQERFAGMIAAKDAVLTRARSFPDGKILHGMLEPIAAWTANSTGRMEAALAKYRNLRLTSNGQRDYDAFKHSFGRLDEKERALAHMSREKLNAFREHIENMHTRVVSSVTTVEDRTSNMLLRDWNNLRNAVSKLSDDVNSVGKSDLDNDIRSAADKAAKNAHQSAKSTLQEWLDGTKDAVDDLLSDGRYRVDANSVDIKFEAARWYTGESFGCRAIKRGDTLLFAFANPWSDWIIEPVKWSSRRCKERNSKSYDSKGCNIDNNKKYTFKSECGKVVNLLVFDATSSSGSKTRICALNTHMSFEGTTQERMGYITEAAEETKDAGCDVVVFVGDFNSRLHCRPRQERFHAYPPNERCNPLTTTSSCGDKNSSFQYVLNTFCDGETCKLRGNPKANFDEMASMLSDDVVSCFEGAGNGKNTSNPGAWSTVDNTIARHGFVEPGGIPDFPPSYKVSARSKAFAYKPEWAQCFQWDLGCFHNEDKKGKHNPAWTDRILVRASRGHQVDAHEYGRRPVDMEYETDHVAVVARLSIRS